ncbi:MAG: bifunctional diaminohydroxyphosphoribosylaminopyrimidine deaminase/5-amino-6-(5-phosphoribosylamino)uracil reductase RibD [Deltaproteobacteria bacterium]|nr:bifunctional diaminohydroxyphosphoribosylaminopyrimidine deaminase/5-amino-6-(5-phosphoribosylamino)uracil reductase RibD [Deltaproteobacteria bacterium]
MTETHIKYMKLAIKEAKKGLGRTAPNPVVGAVIVKEGKVLASGYHHRAGMPHAEVDAFGKIGNRAPGGTLYVTLEPCNHFGKTPPCTELILKSGVKKVVVGMRDPNPLVTGGGCEYLEKKSLEVVTGILKDECFALNESFVKFISTGRPFVIAKSAITLDGWTATSTRYSQWITNEKSRGFVHKLRDRVDAVMMGIGTVLADDPAMTARFKVKEGKDPIRIVVDTNFRTPPDAKVMKNQSFAKTIIATSVDGNRSFQDSGPHPEGVETLVCPTFAGKIDLPALMEKLGEMSISSVLLEGGSMILGAMLRARLIDKFYVFIAPKILGGGDGIPMVAGSGPETMEESLKLQNIKVRRFGDDVLIIGYPGL